MAERGTFPLSPMVISYLSSLSRTEIAHVAELAIERLDKLDGDPDLEPNGDDEPARANGDCEDGAWIEWDQMRGSQKRGPNVLPTYNEDDEDDDPGEEDDHSGECSEDEISCGLYAYGWHNIRAAGCPIADPGGCQHDGREHEDGD